MLKRRLEDLSFKYLRPGHLHNQIDHWFRYPPGVVEKHIIDKVVSRLEDLIRANNISGEVYGRIKHKYSIYKENAVPVSHPG